MTVTNSYLTKTKEAFLKISTNFEVAEPYFDSIVKALGVAARRADDYEARRRGANMIDWESQWDGERCYGQRLMTMVDSWFKIQSPLWQLAP